MNDQAASLRRLLEIKDNKRQAKTIAVVSGKGGVGKSNFALNFSLELIEQGKKVLVFDLDIGMGNIDILLGIHAKKTIVDLFNDQLSIHDIIETGPAGFAYIAGGSGLTDFFILDDEKREYFFDQFNELTEMYDYIIFDMGAGVSESSILFIMAADECIVVTTPEPTSITDAYSMIKYIVNKQKKMPIYILMNRTFTMRDGKAAIERFQRVINQFLEKDVYVLGILPDDKEVAVAVRRQEPFVLLNKKANITKAMKLIVSNYLKGNQHENNDISISFVKRFKYFLTKR